MVEWIRISEGTGAVLDLWSRRMAASPTTGYIMTYRGGGCSANCRFCPQARSGDSNPEKLSRVSWLRRSFKKFKEALSENQESLKRICVQALNYRDVSKDLLEIITEIREASDLPISLSCQPLEREDMRRLAEAGADRLGIPMDAATPEIFDLVKGKSAGGPYEWESHISALEDARELFEGRVTTHLIVGLGESELEMIRRIQFFHEGGISVALFAFTPIEGSDLADRGPPSIERYRRIQLARYLIANDISDFGEMEFENDRLRHYGISSGKLKSVAESGEPFLTSGCPDCNRPYYNESPAGPIYNFPKKLTYDELGMVLDQLYS